MYQTEEGYHCELWMDCAYIFSDTNTSVLGLWFLHSNVVSVLLLHWKVLSTLHISARIELDALFFYDRNCSAEGIILPRSAECLVHPTFMCNGIRNCDDCSDEVEENCLAPVCDSGRTETCEILIYIVFIGQIDIFVFQIEFERCGEGSTQCIRSSHKCNGVVDCLNGYDEDINLCSDSTEQSLFVESRKCEICGLEGLLQYVAFVKSSIDSFQVVAFVVIYRHKYINSIIGPSYSFCLKMFSGSSSARVHSKDGNFFEISGTSLHCSLKMEHSCVLAIEMSNPEAYAQFVM